MNLEMCTQLLGEVGKAPCIFLRCRTLATPVAQQNFMADQVKDSVGVATQLRLKVQEDLGRKSFTPAPAAALIVKQGLEGGAGAVGARRR